MLHLGVKNLKNFSKNVNKLVLDKSHLNDFFFSYLDIADGKRVQSKERGQNRVSIIHNNIYIYMYI